MVNQRKSTSGLKSAQGEDQQVQHAQHQQVQLTQLPMEAKTGPHSLRGSTLPLIPKDALPELPSCLLPILEIADDAIISVDENQCILIFNQGAEKIFGYSSAEAIGLPLDQLLPERLAKTHHHHIAKFGKSDVTARRMGERREIAGRRKDGTEFPAEASISHIEIMGKRVFTAILRDITEQKALEAQLQRKNEELEEQYRRVQEANRLKSEFLANMSHELRTPLNAIIGFTELMYDERVGPIAAHHKEYLGDILTSSKHLLQLINDVLDLSKVEFGKMEWRPELVNIAELVGEVRDILRGLAATKRIRIRSKSTREWIRCLPIRVSSNRCSTITCPTLSNSRLKKATRLSVSNRRAMLASDLR